MTDCREGDLFAPSYPLASQKRPILNRVKDTLKVFDKFKICKKVYDIIFLICASMYILTVYLSLVWVDILGGRFEVGGGRVKIFPRLKLVRIMLENWNFNSNLNLHTYVVLENIPFSNKRLLIFFDVSILLQKIRIFLQKIIPLLSTSTQSNNVRAALEIF